MPQILKLMSPVLSKNVHVMWLQRQIFQLLTRDRYEVVAYGRLKTKENCKLSSVKVVAVAYERFQL